MKHTTNNLKHCLFALGLGCLAACAPTTTIDDARMAYFATVDGNDADCAGWLEWCVDEGYPQEDCEERNEYCVDGAWVGRDDDSSDPCGPVADAAYNDCIDAGGTPEDCRDAAAAAYEDCEEE